MYAIRSSDTLRVYDAYLYRDGLKNIPGRYFDADDKAWVFPYTDEAVRTLELLGARLGDGIEPSSQSKAVAKKYETINTQPRVKATLYAHQVRAYNFALEMLEEGRAAAIFADMGTGKTLITISTVGTLYEQERIHKMLVVCPKSIVGVWEEEFRKFADFRYALTVLDGTLDKKKSAFEYMNGTALQVIVVNYESCWRLEKEVAKWRPDIIVCDESSKIKNRRAARSTFSVSTSSWTKASSARAITCSETSMRSSAGTSGTRSSVIRTLRSWSRKYTPLHSAFG